MSFTDSVDPYTPSSFVSPQLGATSSRSFLSSLFRGSASKTDRTFHSTKKPPHAPNPKDCMTEEQFQAYLKMMQQEGFSSKPSAESIQRAKESFIASRIEKGGLYNLGNTCWLNSLFQILKHSNTYLPFIREKAASGADDQETLLAKAICEVIDLSEQTVTQEVNTQLYDQLELFLELLAPHRPDLTNGRQHDPNEALLFLVDFLHLDQDLSKVSKRSFFKAVHADLHHHIARPDASEQITLSNIRARSIQRALLEEYMAPQTLDKDNQILFEGSPESQRAYKVDYFTTESAPQELVIQAPRFWNGPVRRLATGEMHSDRFKNTAPIIFEPQIQIPLYSSDGSKVERILTLELDTVSGHSGSLAGGHYVAYHNNGDGTFTRYNDSHVDNIPFIQAMREIQEKGYLATYKVVDDKPLREDLTSLVKTLGDVVPQTIPLNPPAQEDRSERRAHTAPSGERGPRSSSSPLATVSSTAKPSFRSKEPPRPSVSIPTVEPIGDGWMDILDAVSQEELDQILREQQEASAKRKASSKAKPKAISLPSRRPTSSSSSGQGEPLTSPKGKKPRKDIERLLTLLTPAQDKPKHLNGSRFSRFSSANERYRF